MRPTFSIIFFTVISGAGYGLWLLIGLGLALLWPQCDPRGAADSSGLSVRLCMYPGVIQYGLAAGFVLVSAGLLASLGHLGQPQRAWRALSQWRSSWLSREGIASILTYVPATALIAILITIWWEGMQPVDLDSHAAGMNLFEDWHRPIGAVLAIGSVATVFCTANIYACLKPIRAWYNRHVVPAYLLLALYGGALCLWALATLPGAGLARDMPALLGGLVMIAAICAALKISYWRHIDGDRAPSAGLATGLDRFGTVRSFEQPHTEENYLTHEMGFVLARKHSRKLRGIALTAGFVAPVLLALIGFAIPSLRGVLAWLALVSGMSGIFVERWLFFAEAKHAVMAYYAR